MWIDAADSGELAAALIPAVWGFLGVVVVTLGGLFVQSMKGRSERTSSPPQPPSDGSSAALLQVARDVARDIGQLDQRVDDHDETIDLMDRARTTDRKDLDDVLKFLNRKEPGWREH